MCLWALFPPYFCHSPPAGASYNVALERLPGLKSLLARSMSKDEFATYTPQLSWDLRHTGFNLIRILKGKRERKSYRPRGDLRCSGISLWASFPFPVVIPPVPLPTATPTSAHPRADTPWHSHTNTLLLRQPCLPCAACHTLTRTHVELMWLELSDTVGPP